LEDMKILENIVDKMNTIFKSVEEFFDLNLILFKKIIKSTNYIHKIYEKINLLHDCDTDNNDNDNNNNDNNVNDNNKVNTNKNMLVKEIIYSFIS